MIEKFLDEYEAKARVAPGLILALPVLADVAYAAPILSSWPIFAATGVCSLALLYGLTHLVRARGKAVETELWKSWGGPPSTRFIRYSDPFFGPALKASIRNALVKTLSLRLPTATDEAKDPAAADRAIVDAFRLVRQYLRRHDPSGLWHKNNVEYGFCRNLLGCREIWAAVAVAATVFAAMYGVRTGTGLFNPASAIGCLSLLCAVYTGWGVLPSATKRTAERYAELAWLAISQFSEQECSQPVPKTA